MALAQVRSNIIYPNFVATTTAPAIGTNVSLTASGHYAAMVIQAREAMTISQVGWRNLTASGTAIVRLATVTPSTGVPTTSNAGGSAPVTESGLALGWRLSALGSAGTFSAGDIFALKIEFNGATIGIGSYSANLFGNTTGLSYNINNTGTDTKTSQGAFNGVLGSSTTTFYHVPGLFPAGTGAVATGSFNSSAAGVKFKVPFKARILGVKSYQGTAVGSYFAGLYDSAGTATLATSPTVDGNTASNLGSNNPMMYFTSPYTLLPDTYYRAVLVATTATPCNMYQTTAPNSDVNYMMAYPGGTDYFLTTNNSTSPTGGTWSDTATSVMPHIDLIFDQLDDGVAGPTITLMGQASM
jgi:hypothetical protein